MLQLNVYLLHYFIKALMKKICLFILTLFYVLFGQAQVLKGRVLNSKTGYGLPLARISCVELQNGTIADSNGFWQLDNMVNHQITLEITADEFETKLVKVNDDVTEIIVKLELEHIHLDEVIISTSESKLQRYNTSPVDSRKISDLNKIENSTLIDALSNIPGIYNMSTGNGISKPVIRGLSGMRVLTVQNGLRIENQQWGNDHGFALNELGIEKVEVIKGPSSLIYGADALGGVIYLEDEPYANENKMEIGASSKFESNSMATTNKVSLKISKNKLRFALYGGYLSRADYGIQNDQFVKNSRNSGSSLKAAFGYNNNNWITNLRYQLLDSYIGLPGHTHDSIFIIDDFLSDIQNRRYTIPAQKITNHLALWENKFYWKRNKLVAQLGFTSNHLREFEEKVSVAAMDLTLQNHTYNIRWNHQLSKHFELVSGSQGMMQRNVNDANAEADLIPNTNLLDLGAYSLIRGTFDLWNLQAGARYDQRNVSTQETGYSYENDFNGLNYSFGISRSSKKFTTRLNASTGFRPPHVSEVLANGVHHGSSRYLFGDENLISERANQIDLFLGMHGKHLEVVVNPFINTISNFIYQDPTNQYIDGYQVFNIEQTDALLTGGDLAVHYHPHIAHWLHIESNFSILNTHDQSGNPLPQIPQNRWNTILKVQFEGQNKLKLNAVLVQYSYYFDQDKIASYELKTNAYQLINIGLKGAYEGKQKLEFSTGINNLLNTSYIDHLSRLKPFGIYNPGRNFYIKLSFKLLKN